MAKIGTLLQPAPSSLAISWRLSTISGYGIYGLQILQSFLRRGGSAQNFILTAKPLLASWPSLDQEKTNPIFKLGEKLENFLRENPEEILSFKHPVLHGSGNDFAGFENQDRIWGEPNVACTALEHLVCTPHGKEIAKHYDMFIAISKWNADYLKSLDIGPVHLCYQGIDPSFFYPAACSKQFGERFVIFSGGKFEYRKGQDIVLAAFKHFYAKHKDALLVTSWQNVSPPNQAAFALSQHCQTVPEAEKNINASSGLKIKPWLLEEGLPEGSFIDLPFTPNMLMPAIMRDCDMALFPNRCEGGTNLVAMEAMACGIPTYVSYNSGQRDLVDLIGAFAFRKQTSVKLPPSFMSVEGWGETDLEEVIAAMEYVYTNRGQARSEASLIAQRMKNWEWHQMNEKLLDIVFQERNT